MITFPTRTHTTKLFPGDKRLFIGAYGFEMRSLGWAKYQREQGDILNRSLILKYVVSKGRNRIKELRRDLEKIGVSKCIDIPCDIRSPNKVEKSFSEKLEKLLPKVDEVVIDISALTKLMVLVCLCALSKFKRTVRIVYSEAENYAPTLKEYEKSKHDMEMIATFPSQGVESIIRMKCLSSIRMQGQPVVMIAFTSFNEQLVRHMLGTINPHRLFFINGRPPRADFSWRIWATHEIHKRLIEEYPADNPFGKDGLLDREASTLEYVETIDRIDEIYDQLGTHNRIICSATGSKMQTLGLFFSKMKHPDIHIEYPTPDSYFVKRMNEPVRNVHEVVVPQFSKFLQSISR